MKKILTCIIVVMFIATAPIFAQKVQDNASTKKAQKNQVNSCIPCSQKVLNPPLTDEQAKKMFNDFVKKNNLKDYSIANIVKHSDSMGTTFKATLKGSSNDNHTLIIDSTGTLKGPFPALPIEE